MPYWLCSVGTLKKSKWKAHHGSWTLLSGCYGHVFGIRYKRLRIWAKTFILLTCWIWRNEITFSDARLRVTFVNKELRSVPSLACCSKIFCQKNSLKLFIILWVFTTKWNFSGWDINKAAFYIWMELNLLFILHMALELIVPFRISESWFSFTKGFEQLLVSDVDLLNLIFSEWEVQCSCFLRLSLLFKGGNWTFFKFSNSIRDITLFLTLEQALIILLNWLWT